MYRSKADECQLDDISVHCITLILSGVCVFCVTAYSHGVHPLHCAKGAVIICLQSSSE